MAQKQRNWNTVRSIALLLLVAMVMQNADADPGDPIPVPRRDWPVAEIARAGRASFPTLFATWTDAEITAFYRRWNAMNHFPGDAGRRINMAHGLQETFIFAERVLNEEVAAGRITRAQARQIANSGALWRASYATGNTVWDLQGGPGGNASMGARLTPEQEVVARRYWRNVVNAEAAAPRASTAINGFALSLFGPEIIDSMRERLSGRPNDEVDRARSQFYVFAGTLAYRQFRSLPISHQIAIGGAVRGAAGAAGSVAVRVALPVGLIVVAVGLVPPAIVRQRVLAEQMALWNQSRIDQMNAPLGRWWCPAGTVLPDGSVRVKVPFFNLLPADQQTRFGYFIINGPSVRQVHHGLWNQYRENVDRVTRVDDPALAGAFGNLERIIGIAAEPREPGDWD